MTSTTNVTASFGMSFLIVASLVGGCTGTVPPIGPLPSELEFVEANRSIFAEQDDDSLKGMVPGSTIDDLSTLDGCWGVALLTDAFVSGRPLFALYFVSTFNRATGEYVGWGLTTDGFGLVRLAGGEAGTFSVEGDNRVVIRTLKRMGYDEFTGAFDEVELPEPNVSVYLATLSGDKLRLHFGDEDRVPVDPGDDAVYRRFDCPE